MGEPVAAVTLPRRLRGGRWLRPLGLGLWGAVLLQGGISGRLDLLLRAVFHPLVWISGVVLVVAIGVLLVPPRPSFADLAANRGRELLDEPGLNFVVPPGQRTLTEWVRLLRSEPDPKLHAGDPVRISGFVLPVPGDRPQLARLLVRCCLVDATPVGLPVLWLPGRPLPQADQWLELRGVMDTERFDGQTRSVIRAQAVRVIPRPARPLEP
jgi:uncharacterized repeat protein (TIGR03943 family)